MSILVSACPFVCLFVDAMGFKVHIWVPREEIAAHILSELSLIQELYPFE